MHSVVSAVVDGLTTRVARRMQARSDQCVHCTGLAEATRIILQAESEKQESRWQPLPPCLSYRLRY